MSEPVSHALRAGVVTGYAEPTWCTAGEHVELKLGGPRATLPLSVVRLRHGDPDLPGPGLLTEPVEFGQPAHVDVSPRDLALGSYVVVPNVPPLPEIGGTFSVELCPTLLRRGWQTVALRPARGDGLGFGLFIGGDGILAGCAIEADGRAIWTSSQDAVRLHEWQTAVLVLDAERGELRLWHRRDGATTLSRPAVIDAGSRSATAAELVLGAAPDPTRGGGFRHHLNGLLARPLLLGAPLAAEAVERLLEGDRPGPVLADWCFGLEVTGRRLVDRSATGAHGVIVGAPSRAVPGPGWRAFPADRYRERPDDYDAIHLHDDDIDDAAWPASATVDVPGDAAPGIYAARVDDAEHALWLPFVVAGATPSADALVLVPTFSWQAYSSNRQPFTWTEDGAIDLSLGAYDLHADGSPVYYTSARRPHRAGAPDRGFRAYGAHNLTANLYLIDWLDEFAIPYDVASDHHLHRDGARAALALQLHRAREPPRVLERSDAAGARVLPGGRRPRHVPRGQRALLGDLGRSRTALADRGAQARRGRLRRAHSRARRREHALDDAREQVGHGRAAGCHRGRSSASSSPRTPTRTRRRTRSRSSAPMRPETRATGSSSTG